MARRRISRAKRTTRNRVLVLSLQVGAVALFLAAWHFLPKIGGLAERSKFFDTFFISSPGDTFDKIVDLGTGRDNSVVIWPYIWRTIVAAAAGFTIGTVLGAIGGLITGNSLLIKRVVNPFIVALNATPRIAFIPVIIILFGPTRDATIASSFMVVFFVTFFNAYEGASTVAVHRVQHAQILGASASNVMLRVRLRYVTAWVMAAFPVAIAFSLVSVVTAEILTGYNGVGRLISIATFSADSSLTFAIVFYLATVGGLVVTLADLLKRRVLHWWLAEGGN